MDTHPWTSLRARLYVLLFRSPKSNRLMVRLAGLTATDRALDIGCGPGAAVRMAADVVVDGEAVGVDRALPMVEIARRRSTGHPNARFEVGAAEELPFPDNAFTVVWTAHSFHHWESRRTGLSEMHRVLVPGGRALILETHGKKHGLTDPETQAVMADLESLGFRDVSSEQVDAQVIISGMTESPGVEP